MSWKQPIPTNLEEIFGKDYLCQALYKELIYRSANKDGVWSMGETLSEIKRGQVIFGRIQFGRYLGWSPSRVERTLKKLVQKPDIITVIRRDRDCSVFYINNYEEITKMDITPDINRTSTGHQPDTSKSVKSVKNTVGVATNIEISNNQKEIISFWNDTYGKNYKPSLDLENNISYWLKKFTLPEIKTAIKNIKYLYSQEFWRNMRPSLFFRQRNKLGEADYIETALNTDKEKGNTSDELLKQIGL